MQLIPILIRGNGDIMKGIVLGLGSMGRRRIRLVKAIDDSIELIGVDVNQQRREAVAKEFQVVCIEDLSCVEDMDVYDFILVCTPPLSHKRVISELLGGHISIFSELNLTNDGYEDIILSSQKSDQIIFLSSTMMYRKEIQYIHKVVESHDALIQYNYHVGQYLPDWHPWESYKDFFVGKKESNGCREILAIELPWLTQVFGPITEVVVRKHKMSQLELSFEDTYLMILTHKTGHIGVLTVDLVSRTARRDLSLVSEYLTVSWKGTPDSLKRFDVDASIYQDIALYDNVANDERYASNIIEDAYKEELECFFYSIENVKNYSKYSYTDDLFVMNLIDEIENE